MSLVQKGALQPLSFLFMVFFKFLFLNFSESILKIEHHFGYLLLIQHKRLKKCNSSHYNF